MKKPKLFNIFALSLLFMTVLAGIFWRGPKDVGKAYKTGLECQRPVPLAGAVLATGEMLDEIYTDYKALSYALDRTLTQAQEMLGELEGDVCDFSKCEPNIVQEKGTAININMRPAKYDIFDDMSSFLWGTCVLGCQPQECKGDPCNAKSIEVYLASIKAIKESQIENIYEQADSYLNDKNYPISEEIKLPGEKTGENKLVITDYIERLVDLADSQLTPPSLEASPDWVKSTCVMSDIEKLQYQSGEIMPRFYLSCYDALTDGSYWPRPWSYFCSNVCDDGPSEECMACLRSPASCSETSWYAEFNCQMFKECLDPAKGKTACSEGFTPDCFDCLCQKFSGQEDAYQKCLNFLCWNSVENLVCCGNIESAARPDATEEKVELKTALNQCYAENEISNWETQKLHASNPLRKLLNCLADSDYPIRKDDQCQWLITSISDSHETASMSKCIWPNYDQRGQCTADKCGDESFFECDCCFHQKGSSHYGGKKAAGTNNQQCMGLSYAVDIDNMADEAAFKSALNKCINDLGYTGKVTQYDEATHLHISACQVNGCDCN